MGEDRQAGGDHAGQDHQQGGATARPGAHERPQAGGQGAVGLHEGGQEAVGQGAGGKVGQQVAQLGDQADRAPGPGLVVLVDAQAHQGLGPGVAQAQEGEHGEPGQGHPPGPHVQPQEHHGHARTGCPQAQQGGGAQPSQGGDQAGAGQDPDGGHGLQASHSGRADVGQHDGLEQHLQHADGQGHKGHEAHQGAQAGADRQRPPAAQEVVGQPGTLPLAGATSSDGAHDGPRAGRRHQAGGSVQDQQPPQAHDGQQEARQQRGQQVAGGGGGLEHPGAAHVVLLAHQVAHRGAQGGLGQGREAGGGRHARQDVGEPGRRRAQGHHDHAQADHGAAVPQEHHEPAVEAVGQGAGERGQQDDRGEGAQLDQGHRRGRAVGVVGEDAQAEGGQAAAHGVDQRAYQQQGEVPHDRPSRAGASVPGRQPSRVSAA